MSTTNRRDRSSKKAQTLLARYGLCAVCESPVSIPGLDGYKCSVCGWIKVTEIALLLKRREKADKRGDALGGANPLGLVQEAKQIVDSS